MVKVLDVFAFSNPIFFGLLIFCVIGAVGYFGYRWLWSKNVYKFPFIIFNDKGMFRKVTARVVKTSRGIRKLQLKGYEDPTYWLSIRDPNGYFDGKQVRIVAFDGRGNLAYCDDFKLAIKKLDSSLDKSQISLEEYTKKYNKLNEFYNPIQDVEGYHLDRMAYLETKLTPIEESEQVDAIIEANNRHNPVNPLLKWVGFAAIILGMFVFLGVYFNGEAAVQIAEKNTATADVLREIEDLRVKNQEQYMRLMKENNIAIESVLNYLTNNNHSIVFNAD